jgi:hypothetical protein
LTDEDLALRRVRALIERGLLEEARAELAQLGDGDSLSRRLLVALVDARLDRRNAREFREWRAYAATSDSHLNGFYATELPALVGAEALARSFESARALADVLRSLDDEMVRGGLVAPPTAREQAVEALHALPRVGVAGTLRAIDELQSRHPRSVQARCYRGELFLWLGRWREAWHEFVSASRIEPARWAEIGKLAVLALTGHTARAIRQADLAVRSFTPLAGSTLPVYLGVLERRTGRLDEAVAHLDAAVETKPTRLGARVELCLALRSAGRGTEAVAHAATVVREAAAILVDSAEALGIDWRADRARLVGSDVFERSLHAMRGNRSSAVVSWFDRRGALRFLDRA